MVLPSRKREDKHTKLGIGGIAGRSGDCPCKREMDKSSHDIGKLDKKLMKTIMGR